jgi:hypothetical protein
MRGLIRSLGVVMAATPSSSVWYAARQAPPGAVGPAKQRARPAQRASTSIITPLFILSLALPIIFYAGPLRLSPYRVILLGLFVPYVLLWLSGQCGRIRLPDVLILLASVWGTLALTINHGVETAWQPSGILLIETFGAYLLARRLIRSQEDFRTMVRVLFWTICALLPFAAIESLTGRAILIEALDGFATVIGKTDMDPRHGWYRAQVAFEHPILYGVFCASGIGLTYYVMGPGRSTVRGLFRVAPVTLAAMFSVSAGAAAMIVSQFGLGAWHRITQNLRHRWGLLGVLFIAAYVVIDLLSSRTPFHVLVTYLTFSAETGYSRILIWNWGIAEIIRYPVFGIGLGEWERPLWKSGSMDNFWLVIAVRYGVPAFLLLAGAVALIMRALGRADFGDERMRACRAGLLITLAGLLIAGCTVHFWNAIYVWFMFLIGSGVWMLDEASMKGAHDRLKAGTSRERATQQRLHTRRTFVR